MKMGVMILAAFAILGGAHGAGLLFPHMAGNGDTRLEPELDDYYVNLQTAGNYKLYEDPFNDINIGTNGYVTRNQGYGYYTPRMMYMVTNWPAGMIAPLFSDNLLYDGDVSNNVWYRETQDPEMLTKAREAIQPYFSGCGGPEFDPTHLVIVTWQRVSSYCDYWIDYDYYNGYIYYYNYYYYVCNGYNWMYGGYGYRQESESLEREEPNEPEKPSAPGENDRETIAAKDCCHDLPLNGYQLVLATDGSMTFAIFNMHTIEWTCCWEHATSGFSAGDYSRSCDLPGSGTYSIDMLATDSNVNKPGRWIYRVDDCVVHDPQCGHCA